MTLSLEHDARQDWRISRGQNAERRYALRPHISALLSRPLPGSVIVGLAGWGLESATDRVKLIR
jgi:hypothetical protein